MADPHTIHHQSNDEDNNCPSRGTPVFDHALTTLITIDEHFYSWHATLAVSEIRVSSILHTQQVPVTCHQSSITKHHPMLIDPALTYTDPMARPPRNRLHHLGAFRLGPSSASRPHPRRKTLPSCLPSRLESPQCQLPELGCCGSGKADS